MTDAHTAPLAAQTTSVAHDHPAAPGAQEGGDHQDDDDEGIGELWRSFLLDDPNDDDGDEVLDSGTLPVDQRGDRDGPAPGGMNSRTLTPGVCVSPIVCIIQDFQNGYLFRPSLSTVPEVDEEDDVEMKEVKPPTSIFVEPPPIKVEFYKQYLLHASPSLLLFSSIPYHPTPTPIIPLRYNVYTHIFTGYFDDFNYAGRIIRWRFVRWEDSRGKKHSQYRHTAVRYLLNPRRVGNHGLTWASQNLDEFLHYSPHRTTELMRPNPLARLSRAVYFFDLLPLELLQLIGCFYLTP